MYLGGGVKSMAAFKEVADPGTAPGQRRFGARYISTFLFAIIVRAGKVLGEGIGFTFLFGAATGLPAAAQEAITNGGTVVATLLSGFEAPGISVGEFLLKTKLSSGVVCDTNILRSHSPTMHDYIFFVAPSFDLTRNGRNHTEKVVGSVSSVKYARYGANNVTNISVRASENYFLSPTSRILLNATILDGYEGRVSTNHEIPSDAASPVHQQVFTESIGYRKSWKKVDAGANLTLTRKRFDDVLSTTGAFLNQTDRNEDVTSFDVFLDVQHLKRIRSNLTFETAHTKIRDRLRSVDTWRLADKITVDLTSKTSVSFLAGVREQDYYNNPDAQIRPLVEYEATLRWSPTRTLILTAKGGYNDTGVDFTEGIESGGVSRHGSLEMTYRIRRDLQLIAGVSYDKTHLSDDQGVLTSFGSRAALTYELSSHAGLSFLYTFDKFESTDDELTSYDESVFLTSLNLRF